MDDFFTQFLDKKKRNYTKKLEKIEQLQKKAASELTTEQRELVNNRAKVVEDAAYFDEIKQLYFAAYNKKEGQKQVTNNGNVGGNVASPLGLFYLAKAVKEQGENALRVVSGQGVEFQEKLHNYNRTIFQQDVASTDGLKKAEAGLEELGADSDFTAQVRNIWAEDQLSQKQQKQPEVAPVAKETQKETTANKPQLFAMSSDEDEEEAQDDKPVQSRAQATQQNEDSEFKPNFVPLPEDDNEDNFAFEGGNKVRGDRRGGRKPRGDRPYRKYDGDRREDREERQEREGEQDNREQREPREKREYRGDGESRGYRGNRYNREGGDYKGNREGGEYRANREGGEYRNNKEGGEYRNNREGGEYRGNREDREGGNYKGDREGRGYRGYRDNNGDREGGEYRNNREGGDRDNREGKEGEERYRNRPPREGRNYDRNQDGNREDGERRGRGYGGRGRGDRNPNAPRGGDNNYQKRDANVEKRAD